MSDLNQNIDPRTNVFTRDEVKQHNTKESCWLIVEKRVYDVTSWLPKHPAGPNSILRHAGTDSTEDFGFHSTSAQKLWQKYWIGVLDEPEPSCIIS
eukprot:TRINITY_DN7974_c0_g1_i1.p1 TRINITY_DN7974_c0_g1~~TRINITY_DN7974_c0_g1_i1.p1  ORF type:complete len:111 (-),score=29.26 TRINITY_DN7974_c0_g1_i1:183-470(-)